MLFSNNSVRFYEYDVFIQRGREYTNIALWVTERCKKVKSLQNGGIADMTILETTDLKKYYGAGENITKALDGVSLKIEDGQFVAIVGASGSGKSTLLNMIGGLDNPTSGNVLVKGKSIGMLKEEELTIFRRRNIGFVFQNYNLIPTLNVYENIVFPVELDGKNVDQTFFNKVVSILGIDKKLENLPNNLSGGQQQRVAIARALITKPTIVLADEPTGGIKLVVQQSQKNNVDIFLMVNTDFLED